jgi:chromosome segregation ATPase
MIVMTKYELDVEIERLKKALSRARTRIKTLSGQAKADGDIIASGERKIKRLTRANDRLLSRCATLRSEFQTFNAAHSELAERFESANKQNAVLRHRVELANASSTEPRYDVLRDKLNC